MSNWGAPPSKESNDKFFKGAHGTPWNRDLLWINRVNSEKKQTQKDEDRNNSNAITARSSRSSRTPKKLSGKYAKLGQYIKSEVQSITDSRYFGTNI